MNPTRVTTNHTGWALGVPPSPPVTRCSSLTRPLAYIHPVPTLANASQYISSPPIPLPTLDNPTLLHIQP